MTFGLEVLASFIGSMVTLILWVHFDLEGAWESYRLRHGAHLDARQRRAAERHDER